MLDKENIVVTNKSIILFWGFTLFALFFMLGHKNFDNQELLLLNKVREMVSNGNFFISISKLQNVTEISPLLYWTFLPFAMIFGNNSEIVMRLPSVVVALISIVAFRKIAKILFDYNICQLSSFILISTYAYISIARMAVADIFIVAMVLLAVWVFLSGKEKMTFGRYLSFYLFSIAAALYGNVLCAFMPFIIILPWIVRQKKWKNYISFYNVFSIFIAISLYALPFYIYTIINKGEGMFWNLIFNENIISLLKFWQHDAKSYYIIFYNIIIMVLPWSVWLFLGIINLCRNYKSSDDNIKNLLLSNLLLFVYLLIFNSNSYFSGLFLIPFIILLGSAGISITCDEKCNKAISKAMWFLLIIVASLFVASVIFMLIWAKICPFELPLIVMISVPLTGLLVLAIIIYEILPDNVLANYLGIYDKFAGTVIGFAILSTLFSILVIPAFSWDTENKFFIELTSKYNSTPSNLFYFWDCDVPPKFLFYKSTNKSIANNSFLNEYDKQLNHLKLFIEESGDNNFIILTKTKNGKLNSLEKMVSDLNLNLSVDSPLLVENAAPIERHNHDKWMSWKIEGN